MSYKHLILGGARSGKSRYAEQCAIQAVNQSQTDRSLSYIATAKAGDAEMANRIADHQARRDARWQLIEAHTDLADALSSTGSNSVVLIDCLTLWLSNCLHQECWQTERAKFLKSVSECEQSVIMVSNEVGSGIVPLGELSREFVDQSGWLHQELAQRCSQVDLVVAGLPLSLKPNTAGQ
ncbi:bifunctional adenosylcobinamide kinase/adenosylcobinamide-phosphate guanylyltransferase [Arenicella xantha]|uniref:Bifunctional adenosylcobalamin biosynthesis protein n=1 Tax=Arenicella xantha TaxID=644221 RepID=A0A395JGS5_9GAMM|nr:bifunctional adenosylcobinamide kinase/adenosylcobinamide-phosphate guanylyltransferase [Arenicella xantha]RBP48592.1 adenosylcobinamide kinase /adenosylcobinamide-phosphate guanylyltransferase [Arenicella xantha]